MSKDLGDKTMDRVDNVNPVHAGWVSFPSSIRFVLAGSPRSNQANPFFGAEKAPHRGNGFENAPRLHLVDAGMANSLPTHVFLYMSFCMSVLSS